MSSMFYRRSREFKSGDRLSGRLSANGFSTGSDSNLKLDEGTIKAVEASLCEALTLNNEEARALLGRMEYHKQNFEAALHIFEGIQVEAIFPRVKLMQPAKTKHKRGKPLTDSQAISLPASIIQLEAVFLKAKALEQLGRISEAAQVCNVLVGSFAEAFPHGLPEHLKRTKLQESFNKVLEFLPEIFKREGMYVEALVAYRRALLSDWESDSNETLRNLQVGFAILLLYGGAEAPTCPSGLYGGFVPSNNVEEAIFVLMTIAKRTMESKSSWDPEVMEHLCFALATSGHFKSLAEQYESVLPGIYSRTDRWFSLALCYMAAKESQAALNLLKKSLGEVEKPNDVLTLLHAASICSRNEQLSSEGVIYSRRAVDEAKGAMGYLQGRAWQVLGVALSMKARSAASNAERARIHKDALHALQEAAKLERKDAEVVFQLGLVYAEQGNLKVAVDKAKAFLELTDASSKGWRFLAILLSAQQRFKEAEMVIDAALQQTSNCEWGKLLLTKAKLQAARLKHPQALETYKLLLSLAKEARVSELVVWQEMAALFTSLSTFEDAERCLQKAKMLDAACAKTWYEYGNLYTAQRKIAEALSAYNTALTCDPEHGDSKVGIASLLCDSGAKSLPVARSFLNAALRSQPRSPSAWLRLGVVHELENRLDQAADCFQTAFVLDQSAPVESFTTLLEM